MGGGAGGIIQIISPTGRLPLNALSVKRGEKFVSCEEAEDGYYFVAGHSKADNVKIFPDTKPYNWSSNSSLSSPPCFSVTSTHQSFTDTAFIATSSVKIPTTIPLQSSSVVHSSIMGLFVMLTS